MSFMFVTDFIHSSYRDNNFWKYKKYQYKYNKLSSLLGGEHTIDYTKQDWGYECTGIRQSPIDIKVCDSKYNKDLSLIMHYEPTDVSIEKNTHTLKINYDTLNNYVVYNGMKYILQQFHFHWPSEHTFDGYKSGLEIHLVHKVDERYEKNIRKNFLVIGILCHEDETCSWCNTFLENNQLTKQTKIKFDASMFDISSRSEYFTYNGSLTTPKCNEDVRWIVLKQQNKVSKDMLDAFRTIINTNARFIQTNSCREIERNFA